MNKRPTLSTATRSSYFDSLSAVRDEIMERLEIAKAELDYPWFFLDSMSSFERGVNYGEQAKASAKLRTLKSKKTKKMAHAVVDRCASGRYELTFYIL